MTSPYTSFAKVFGAYHEQYAEPQAGPSSSKQLDTALRYDVVLDEEGGLLTSLMSSLEQSLLQSETIDGEGMGKEEREALLLEHRTWQLVRAVYENRIERADPSFLPPTALVQLHENPYISPEELTQLIVNEDPELSLYATLVEHLQSRPLFTSPPPLEARHGYLPTTLRRGKAAQLSSTTTSAVSLDPDFVVRDPHGKGLAGEDESYQRPLMETLWDLVRHGELDSAIRVCEQGGEPWRAASIMGGRRWSMGGMTRESIGMTALEGNRTRGLWKKSCRAIANNETIRPHERYLYAALISDLPALLPACESWEDHLWAHIQARIEARIEARRSELAGFWAEEDALLGKDEGDEVVRGDLDEVFRTMGEVKKPGVLMANSDPYRVAQRMIILGRTGILLEQFAERIPGLQDSVAQELIGPLVRFFSHLVLVLRILGEPVPDEAANSIVQAYLHVLESEGNDSLVAMYAACLREGSGEASYARFLRSMDPNASREARMEALNRAKTHNLDVATIAIETVRLTLQEAFAMIPALSLQQPDITSFASGISERDVHLIRAIEWLTMVPETLDEALIKSNDVCRYFLALGKANAALNLLRTLPNGISNRGDISDTDDLIEADQDQDQNHQALEHEQFQQLFGVFACHELVEDVMARIPKTTATKMEWHNWQKSLGIAIERTHNATIDLLISDWLRFHVSSRTENSTQRRKELGAIRQIFIPDLVLRLHTLLMSHASRFPQLKQQALDLTKVVAAEENHIYEEFFGWGQEQGAGRLVVYLEKVREAGLEALKTESGSAFVVRF
ncbi:putative nuclear pore complex protein [Naematelia encephala]|uniref:Nuclear pore complex protein n=1 Tax=Naematelia encephala TaxID=71784 RepID=A0A1Y2BFA2_9TREE|nr:putative nuclear pore complex protein [Naematelia encephala]